MDDVCGQLFSATLGSFLSSSSYLTATVSISLSIISCGVQMLHFVTEWQKNFGNFGCLLRHILPHLVAKNSPCPSAGAQRLPREFNPKWWVAREMKWRSRYGILNLFRLGISVAGRDEYKAQHIVIVDRGSQPESQGLKASRLILWILNCITISLSSVSCEPIKG